MLLNVLVQKLKKKAFGFLLLFPSIHILILWLNSITVGRAPLPKATRHN